jgi:hypothetical protein
MSSSKVNNSTIKGWSNSEVDDLKRKMTGMINENIENELKENSNK